MPFPIGRHRYPVNVWTNIRTRQGQRKPRVNDAMNDEDSPFLARLDAVAADIEVLLDRLLAAAPVDGESSRPARLIEAMRYASLGGGKRFRPFLVVECAALFEVPRAARPDGGRGAGMRALLLAWCMTTCRPWTTTICGAAGRPRTRRSTKRPRSWPATACSPSPSTSCRGRDPRRPARARRAGHGAGARVGRRRHGRRPDARSRRRRPLRAKPRRARVQREDVRTLAGDEDRRAAALRLRGRRHFGRRRRRRSARRWSATARRSARRSRSPTTCSTSKAIRRWSASRPARTPPPARPPWSACSACRPPRRRLKELVAEAEQALAPFGSSPPFSSKGQNSSPIGMPDPKASQSRIPGQAQDGHCGGQRYPGLCATFTPARRTWPRLNLAKDGSICRPSWAMVLCDILVFRAIVLCDRERTGPELSVDFGTPTANGEYGTMSTFIRLRPSWRRRCLCRRRSRHSPRPTNIAGARAHKAQAHKAPARDRAPAKTPAAAAATPSQATAAAHPVHGRRRGCRDHSRHAGRALLGGFDSGLHRRLAAAARTLARAVERRRRRRVSAPASSTA